MIVNFGPGHPATHGVLRLLVEMSFEIIVKVDVHVGLLHRSTEKLMELKSILHSIPYFDRLDYMSCYSQEDALMYAICVYLGTEVAGYSSTLRLIVLELTRLLNHTLAIACHIADVGAISPILGLFEERERYYELLERISGTRLHNAMFMLHACQSITTPGGLIDTCTVVEGTISRVEESMGVCEDSSIMYGRLHNIGVVSYVELLAIMATGPILRSCGITFDLRTGLLDVYTKVSVGVCYSTMADCFDRLFIRFMEMVESVRLILSGVYYHHMDTLNTRRQSIFHRSITTMEDLIALFVRLCSLGNDYCATVTGGSETPKGMFGVYLCWLNDTGVFRAKIRCTGIHHLMGMILFVRGDLIADMVAVIGTIDIVFGEIDR